MTNPKIGHALSEFKVGDRVRGKDGDGFFEAKVSSIHDGFLRLDLDTGGKGWGCLEIDGCVMNCGFPDPYIPLELISHADEPEKKQSRNGTLSQRKSVPHSKLIKNTLENE